MCQDCGCVETGAITIDGKQAHQGHGHDHHHEHQHPPEQGGTTISLKQAILSQNDQLALHNREHLTKQGVTCFNWISAPGSGKTSILESLAMGTSLQRPMAVIEGDQATQNDANRIRQAGARALQINTGSACHLDADMVHKAMHHFELEQGSFLMIENVGNMVCPTAFDLGEKAKIAVISITEGEDKPIKYPDLILTADCLILNKLDLLPHLDFDLDACIQMVKEVNPHIQVFALSAKTGEGLAEFANWLETQAVPPPT